MKPVDFYATRHRVESWRIDTIASYAFIEFGFDHNSDWTDRVVAENRLQIRVHVDPYIDGNRVCTMMSLAFDSQPFMIFAEGGRSGCDQRLRIVTDEPVYNAARAYLLDRLPAAPPVHDPNADLEALDYFYNVRVPEYLTAAPPFQPGDAVKLKNNKAVFGLVANETYIVRSIDPIDRRVFLQDSPYTVDAASVERA